jgi:hypothetical protein
LENVDIFYDHLEYFTDIWYILWPFGTFCVKSVHFFRFWYHVPRIIWQPWYKCVFWPCIERCLQRRQSVPYQPFFVKKHIINFTAPMPPLLYTFTYVPTNFRQGTRTHDLWGWMTMTYIHMYLQTKFSKSDFPTHSVTLVKQKTSLSLHCHGQVIITTFMVN